MYEPSLSPGQERMLRHYAVNEPCVEPLRATAEAVDLSVSTAHHNRRLLERNGLIHVTVYGPHIHSVTLTRRGKRFAGGV